MNEHLSSAAWGFALLFSAAAGFAQMPKPRATPPHEHRLIEVPGEPILTRISVTLARPARVAPGPRSELFFVDSAANKMWKVSGDGKGKLFLAGLSDPSGLCFDKSGHCYVSNFARGEANAGSIVRVSATGVSTVIVTRLTGPKGLAYGPDGKLYVAVFGEDRILSVDAKGQVREFCRNVPAPAALCFDKNGILYAANPADGTVTRISKDGKSAIAWRSLNMPTDLVVSPEGDVLVTSYGAAELLRLLPGGKSETYLKVPAGTIAACFDGGGNVVAVNWDLKLAVRIRDRLSVPCPHCRKMIPVRIVPKSMRKAAKSKAAI